MSEGRRGFFSLEIGIHEHVARLQMCDQLGQTEILVGEKLDEQYATDTRH